MFRDFLSDVASAVGWFLRDFFAWLAENPVIMFGSIVVLGLAIAGLSNNGIAVGMFVLILLGAVALAVYLYKKEEKVATVVAAGIAIFALVGLADPPLRTWFFGAAIFFDVAVVFVAYKFN